jgi:hypothetical protein
MERLICSGCKRPIGSVGIKVEDKAQPPGQCLYFCSVECAEKNGPSGGIYIEELLSK